MDGSRPIHVVAAAIMAADGRVLIAQRPPGKHLAGGWEFPGGKLEPGEARCAGLVRELHEELGISIVDPRPLLRLHHDYDFGAVLIDVWVVKSFAGEPRGLEGQALRWCHLDELDALDLLPADAPIVRALRLPECLTAMESRFYRVLDSAAGLDEYADRSRLLGICCSTVQEAMCIGQRAEADFLVMRQKLAADELRCFCASLALPVYVRGLELEAAWALGATGICAL